MSTKPLVLNTPEGLQITRLQPQEVTGRLTIVKAPTHTATFHGPYTLAGLVVYDPETPNLGPGTQAPEPRFLADQRKRLDGRRTVTPRVANRYEALGRLSKSVRSFEANLDFLNGDRVILYEDLVGIAALAQQIAEDLKYIPEENP